MVCRLGAIPVLPLLEADMGIFVRGCKSGLGKQLSFSCRILSDEVSYPRLVHQPPRTATLTGLPQITLSQFIVVCSLHFNSPAGVYKSGFYESFAPR